MDKDEMKNRISLALKDPILQQGFEIICKENAELKKKCYKKAVKDYCKLEKENAELKEEINKIAFARGNLEEENAELEKSNKEWQRTCEAKSDTNSQLIEQLADKAEKITELEKENAELKHTIATLRQEKDNVSMHAKAMEVVAKTRSDQLTKAKELLKQLVDIEYAINIPKEKIISLRVKAEQFLKDCEV